MSNINFQQGPDWQIEEAPVYEDYEVMSRLGIGAGSIIYAVKNRKTGDLFALKRVVRYNTKDKRLIEQADNEYRMSQRINHPYIRNIYEIMKTKRRLQTREVTLVMEYCPGISLQQSPSRSLLDLLLIFRMVADGINAMHSVGLLHCDIKPKNIIIAENGSIRIIDLGQSCVVGTVKPRIQGTPDYIAPEQVKRKSLTRQTDVFNLGASMYWAFTGKHIPTLIPKSKSSHVDLADSKGSKPMSPHKLKPKIPVGISNLIMESVDNDPHKRPADMLNLISRMDMQIHLIAGGRPTTNQDK